MELTENHIGQDIRMSVEEKYRNKRILITGTTGFLGKVLLQKFLYDLNKVDRIYLLIRRKKGSDVNERFKKQIVSSHCFDRIRQAHNSHFDSFIDAKIRLIEGDLTLPKLGLSARDYEQITTTCHIIINCAASIDFNARLEDAIDSNIRGTLRMLELAQAVKSLSIFTHVSTCYVNCTRKGLVHQEIYQTTKDPQEEFAELIAIPLKELPQREKEILGSYPNTYTFTKSLCQRLLKKKKHTLPLCIVRPAVINSSYRQPFPGWLDSIAAAAAMYMFVGIGIIKSVQGDLHNVGDTVPVDTVVATIIVATAFNFHNEKLPIYHVGTSDRNPMTWREKADIVSRFWMSNKTTKSIGTPHLFATNNHSVLFLKRMQARLPVLIYQKAAVVMGKQHAKTADKLYKSILRGEKIANIFAFFVSHQWIYQTHNFKSLVSAMSLEEQHKYQLDVANINMEQFVKLNNYGIQKYVLNQNIQLSSVHNEDLLAQSKKGTYFSDMQWAMTNQVFFNKKNNNINSIKIKILTSHRVTQTMEEEVLRRMEKKPSLIEKIRAEVKYEAEQITKEIVGQIRVGVVRFMAWTLHKIIKNIYQKVNINMEMFTKLREMQRNENVPIVLMPTHRSYIDFIIVSYIFFVYNLKLPYIVVDEALLSANLLPFLIKSSGAFFFKKDRFRSSLLYRAIFTKYVETLLHDGNNLEFFIEGTRSRTGKILYPQSQILDVLLEAVLSNKINDLCLVPLTINYEKVLEGDTFPNQLLGEEKMHQSLLRVIKAIPLLLRMNFGRVYVEMCTPISVKAFNKEFSSKDKYDEKYKQRLSLSLRAFIVKRMQEKLVIMSTGVVSAVLLMHRKGIQQQQLIKAVNWISRYIIKKGYKIGGINENSSTIAVRNALGYLSQVTKKIKKNIFEVQICVQDNFQKILMLSYYRNTVIHTFMPQAIIGTVMASFGKQLNAKEGIRLPRVYEQSVFLSLLFHAEYNTCQVIQEEKSFRGEIQKMCYNNILQQKEDDKITISNGAHHIISFHCSLLRSLVECSWACLVYIITISRNEQATHDVNSIEKFFDTVQWYMESLYEERVIEHYEACSLESIKNVFSTFEKQNIIQIGRKNKQDYSIKVKAQQNVLEDLENKLKFFIQSLTSVSLTSPMDLAKSSLKDNLISKL